jgi:hypothetical protein
MLAGFVAPTACGSESPTESEPATVSGQPPAQNAAGQGVLPTGKGPVVEHDRDSNLVYERVRIVDRNDQEIAVEERGALTPAIWQRAARPWTHRHEPILYHEQTWAEGRGDGTTEHGFRILRTANDAPPPVDAPAEPPEVAPELLAFAADHPGVGLAVQLSLRDYPQWDIPLVLPDFFSEEERAANTLQRDRAVEMRKVQFAERSGDVLRAIDASGGTLAGLGWETGTVTATISSSALETLSRRTDLANIVWLRGGARDQQEAESAEIGEFQPTIVAAASLQIEDPGLPIWLRFDEAGTLVNTGSMNLSAATLSTVTQAQGGRAHNSVRFTADSSAIVIPDDPDGAGPLTSAALDGLSNLTLEGFVYYDNLNSANYSTMAKKENAYICRAYHNTSTGNYQLQFALFNPSNQWKYVTIPYPGTGTWHHLACTYQLGEMKIYWDGALKQTWSGLPQSPTADSAYPLTLGRHQTSGESLRGRLDNFKLWKATRTAEEICTSSGRFWNGSQCVAHNPWFLGEARSSARLDIDVFHQNGNTGETGNAGRHGYDDITVGINELGSFETSACMFYDGASCTGTSRIQQMFSCTGTLPGSRCVTTGGFGDQDEPDPAALPACSSDSDCTAINPAWGCWTSALDLEKGTPTGCQVNSCCCTGPKCSRHATAVASIIAADYDAGQATGFKIGDNAWTSGAHSDYWEKRMSGLARQAKVILFGEHGSWASSADQGDSLKSSFTTAGIMGVDVLNNSWNWDECTTPPCNRSSKRTIVGPDCNEIATLELEQTAENAYDQGVLVVGSAGNNPGDPGTACDVSSPADIPKVFAVNGVNVGAAGTTCDSDYRTCNVAAAAAALGGATVRVGGVERAGALSVIALAAPTALEGLTYERAPAGTSEDGERGQADDETVSEVFPGRFGGSSAAAGVVTGAAAVLKDFHVARGDSAWINAPGRLFTQMLLMGDRHRGGSVTSQGTTGADKSYGMGRLKLRRLNGGTYGWHREYSDQFTDTAQGVARTIVPWSELNWDEASTSPMKLVKCVLSQQEDMSGGKNEISDIDLGVEIWSSCSGGSLLASRVDGSFDAKKMVAITSADVALGGACVKVVTTPSTLYGGSGTYQVACYASNSMDDACQSNPSYCYDYGLCGSQVDDCGEPIYCGDCAPVSECGNMLCEEGESAYDGCSCYEDCYQCRFPDGSWECPFCGYL